MTLGSLFDGSGGFPLAGAMCGMTPVWASEIEPFPVAVRHGGHSGEIERGGRHMNQIITADALTGLETLASDSINTIVTSPPYYNLRDYGVPGQLGLEDTVEEYISKLVEIFREAKRVLRDDGTLWVNIADSRAGSNKGAANYPDNAKKYKQGTNKGMLGTNIKSTKSIGCKPKDLIGVPWLLAFALRNDGWYLRQDIIWDKPNCMPESVKDRCTQSHEYIFLLSKSRRYYFDFEAIKEPCVGFDKTPPRGSKGTFTKNSGRRHSSGNKERKFRPIPNSHLCGNIPYENETGLRNKRSVWHVSTKGIKEAHFATFPPELIKPCILAGCPVGGVVTDMFSGSGTVGIVAKETGRNYVLIDINPAYNEIAMERINNVTD